MLEVTACKDVFYSKSTYSSINAVLMSMHMIMISIIERLCFVSFPIGIVHG